VQRDEHLLKVCRYVERNALTAGLAERAEDWRWGSLWVREKGEENQKGMLAGWPVERMKNWVGHVNEIITEKELERIRLSVKRGRPFGEEGWVGRSVERLNLEQSVRGEGRPRKKMD
jgi:putative transposase